MILYLHHGTYALSCEHDNAIGAYMKTPTTASTLVGYGSPLTFTCNEWFNIWYYRSGMIDGEIRNVQLEKGSTATTYIAGLKQTLPLNLSSIELCKIDTYQDYITGSYNNWRVVRKVGKKILTGASDEGWGAYSNYYTINKNKFTNANIDYHETNLFINYFLALDATSAQIGGVYVGSANFNFNYDNAVGGVENYKTWLSTHNLIVYYQLATSIEETITNATLISQLNAIYNARSYSGQTNITSTYANEQMIISATALTQMGV